MNRRKFLVGLAAATAVGPVAVQSAEYFPSVSYWPSVEMVEAVTRLTTAEAELQARMIRKLAGHGFTYGRGNWRKEFIEVMCGDQI